MTPRFYSRPARREMLGDEFGTRAGRPVHVVCAWVPEEDLLIVIAVYEPDPNRWDEDFGQRRKP